MYKFNSAVIAIRVGKIMLSFFVISWMIIHFGMNPDRGGSPPIDRRVAHKTRPDSLLPTMQGAAIGIRNGEEP